MQSLNQARRKNASSGQPIYSPVDGLNKAEVFMRKGQLTLVAAGSGSGKTALMHAILHHGDARGNVNPTLYLSLDSDPGVIWKRSAALSTGYNQSDIDQMQARGETASLEAAIQRKESHIQWCFAASPDENYILNEIDAYAELHGAYPEVIVFDNLKDLQINGVDDEFRALEEACMFMKELARDTGAAVVTLHHVGGAYEDGTMPIPMSGLRGKVSKTPAVILTIHRTNDYMNVSPVKNRNGAAEASGRWFKSIRTDLSRMTFQG